MSIIIKDLVSSDIVGASGSFMDLIDKLNFNFDQIIINGGGPIGLPGPKGDIGYPGPAGGRGNFWFAGLTAPSHGDNGEHLIDGDKFIGIDGFIKNYNGSIWALTAVNLMGATGKTGATGDNGYSGGYEVYQGYPNLGYNIVLNVGDALGSTGLTGQSGSYPNFITTTNYKNTVLIGDHTWSANRFKNFGAIYSGGNYFGVGAGISVPKLVLVQETVEAASNFLMSFGAYNLTSGATSNASYGFDVGGGTADFLDFVNVGFKNIPTGTGDYETHFKLISNTIPVDIELGGYDPTPSKKPADFSVKANNINFETWGGNINLTAPRIAITGALSASVMSSFPAGLNVGTAVNVSFSSAFAKVSNELDSGRMALFVSSDFGDNDAIQAVANGNGVTIRAIATGANGTAIKAEGKTNLAGTLLVSSLATFNAGLTASGATFSGTTIHNGLATFNAGLTASSANFSGTTVYNGLATFSTGLTASSANFSGTTNFYSAPNFVAGLNATSATISGTSTHNGLASFNTISIANASTINGVSTFNADANFNSGLTASNINVGTGRIKQNGSEVAPKGEIIMWYGNTLASIPYGYVFCGKWYIGYSTDSAGTSINAGPFGTTSATAVQADLDTYFNTLYSQSLTLSSDSVGGTVYNWYIVFSGNNVLGVTVPDLSGLFLPQSGYRGVNPPKYYSGDAGGLDFVTLTADQSGLPSHNHTTTLSKTSSLGEHNGAGQGYASGSVTFTSSTTGGTSASTAHENRPPFKTVTYLIRVA